jgi:hypothetical protein
MILLFTLLVLLIGLYAIENSDLKNTIKHYKEVIDNLEKTVMQHQNTVQK